MTGFPSEFPRRRTPDERLIYLAETLEPLRSELQGKSEVTLSGVILCLRMMAEEWKDDSG